MAGIVVLGLDPGSLVTGYGVVNEVSGRLSLVAAGTIRTQAKAPLCERLAKIYTGLSTIITEHQPNEAAMEDVFTAKSPQSALKLGQARGAAMAACGVAGLHVSGYEPTKVKKSLVGTGRAEKGQVSFMVARLLGEKENWAVDAGDALAVAICHLNMRRMTRLAGL
ncbi:MAG: crossover junction endodeoxyribonuclease RuvC [Desulfovibrio sp.]|mgnify:CR=1 FL=1|nr:MAG: crossover junction endodeoxyribonuclease RuvC [Desulfovibrio sp.]